MERNIYEIAITIEGKLERNIYPAKVVVEESNREYKYEAYYPTIHGEMKACGVHHLTTGILIELFIAIQADVHAQLKIIVPILCLYQRTIPNWSLR